MAAPTRMPGSAGIPYGENRTGLGISHTGRQQDIGLGLRHNYNVCLLVVIENSGDGHAGIARVGGKPLGIGGIAHH